MPPIRSSEAAKFDDIYGGTVGVSQSALDSPPSLHVQSSVHLDFSHTVLLIVWPSASGLSTNGKSGSLRWHPP